MRICGNAKPGHSSGEAIAEMESLAANCRAGSVTTGPDSPCKRSPSGSQAPLLMALSLLLVFLVLAALYESWSIPLSVLLTVPLGIFGSVSP